MGSLSRIREGAASDVVEIAKDVREDLIFHLAISLIDYAPMGVWSSSKFVCASPLTSAAISALYVACLVLIDAPKTDLVALVPPTVLAVGRSP